MARKFTFVLFTLLTAAQAQTIRGVIGGTVSDPRGAPVGKASVTITNRETGASRSAMTDTRGEFTVPSLDVGPYLVTVESNGLRTHRQQISLEMNQEVRVDIRMVFPTTDTAEVVSAPELLRTYSRPLARVGVA